MVLVLSGVDLSPVHSARCVLRSKCVFVEGR